MSNRIHITVPANKTVHIISGYHEVIETLLWGLKEIGYDASFSFNEVLPNVRNIVFRADATPLNVLKTFRTDTIVYNLEQSYTMFRRLEKPEEEPLARIWEKYQYIRKNFEVWDYSQLNIDSMLKIDSKMPVKLVPIGFAPISQRIPRLQSQDIDVLIYGMPHESRLGVFKKICEYWLRSIFVCGLYGHALDELIGRSKIILNISGAKSESIFPIVRASHPLANKKLVISDDGPNLYVEDDIRKAVHFYPEELIPSVCNSWLSNDNERLEAENKGFNIMAQRDIRAILQKALS